MAIGCWRGSCAAFRRCRKRRTFARVIDAHFTPDNAQAELDYLERPESRGVRAALRAGVAADACRRAQAARQRAWPALERGPFAADRRMRGALARLSARGELPGARRRSRQQRVRAHPGDGIRRYLRRRADARGAAAKIPLLVRRRCRLPGVGARRRGFSLPGADRSVVHGAFACARRVHRVAATLSAAACGARAGNVCSGRPRSATAPTARSSTSTASISAARGAGAHWATSSRPTTRAARSRSMPPRPTSRRACRMSADHYAGSHWLATFALLALDP